MTPLAKLRANPRVMIYPVLTVATLALGALREVVIAQQFGLGWQLDAYAAVACFYLFFGTQIGNGLETTFIAKYSHLNVDLLSGRLVSSQKELIFIQLILLAALALAGRPLLAVLFEFREGQLDLAYSTLLAFLPPILLCALVGLPRAVLTIRGSYALGFGYGAILSLSVIAAALATGSALGVLSLPLGYAIGNLCVLAIFFVLWRRMLRGQIAAGEAKSQPAPRPFELWSAAGMVLIVEVLYQGSYLTERSLAAPLGEGSLSAYFYAMSVAMIFGALVAQPIATIVSPKIARQYQTDRASAKLLVLRICGAMFAAACLATWVMYELANFLIEVLLVRGKFTLEDGRRTAEIFRTLIFAIPFMSIARILKNSLYSGGSYRMPIITISVRWLLLALVAAWLLPTHGIVGLAVASAASMAADCVLMLLFFLRRT